MLNAKFDKIHSIKTFKNIHSLEKELDVIMSSLKLFKQPFKKSMLNDKYKLQFVYEKNMRLQYPKELDFDLLVIDFYVISSTNEIVEKVEINKIGGKK